MKLQRSSIVSIFFTFLIISTGIVDLLVLGGRFYIFVLFGLVVSTFFLGFLIIYLSKNWKSTVVVIFFLIVEVWLAKMAIASVIWYFRGLAP
jgi:hypothetical protein